MALGLAPLAIGAGFEIINGLIREGRMGKAREYINSMPIPDIDKMSYTAILMDDPEKLVPIMQQDSRLSQITEDPRLRDAQMQSLADLQQRGQEGYTIQEKADLQRGMDASLGRQRGANLAMDSQMARRGISGSGIDIAGRLARQQAGIQSANQMGLDIASQGQQRALQAMQSAGQLGGQIRGQEWGQQAQTATAQDAINRANVANQNTGNQFNIGNQMAQSQFNAQQATETARAAAEAERIRAKAESDKAAMQAQTYMR